MADAFQIEKQTKDMWCWAAVSVSVNRYFSPKSKWTQCRVAREVTHNQNCCGDKEACNLAEKLEDGLKAVEHWKETLDGVLTFEQIQSEIDASRPVCARIGWRHGGGHFVIISGYRL